MPRCLGIRINNGLPSDFVRIREILEIVVGHIRSWIVDPSNLAFLANLDLGGDRVNRARGMVDVRDRAGGRHGLQVLVVDAVLQNRVAQGLPVGRSRDRDAVLFEQRTDPFGARSGRPRS